MEFLGVVYLGHLKGPGAYFKAVLERTLFLFKVTFKMKPPNKK